MTKPRVARRGRYETRPDRCADQGHPGVTWNARENRTWCLCGEHAYPGRTATADQHLACCDGPLTERIAS